MKVIGRLEMVYVARVAFFILLLGLIIFVQGSAVIANEDKIDFELDIIPGETEQNNLLRALNVFPEQIVFGEIVPDSVYKTVDVPSDGADIDIFARDCCIRDDIVEIYVDGCLLATVDSIGGDWGSHPGETHTVSLGPGTHTIEYRNVFSGVGPSGWYVAATPKLYTGGFRCGECVTPDGSSPIYERITRIGTCPDIGDKFPRWGSFGVKRILVADSGEELKVECALIGEGLAAFVMYYSPAEGNKLPVGLCPFISGCNSAGFWHSGDSNNNGQPDCFVKTNWRSRDYGTNDIPNRWTDEQEEDPALLDWADSQFYMHNTLLDRLDHKFEYRNGVPNPWWPPSWISCDDPNPEGNWVKSMHVEPEIWPEAGLFSTFMFQQKDNIEFEPPPMGESPYVPCDLDHDGDCDEVDEQIFNDAFGKCRGELGYSFNADIDGDGCVVTADNQVLTVGRFVDIDLKPGSNPNCVNPDSKGRVAVAIFGNGVDVVSIDQSTIKFGNLDPKRCSIADVLKESPTGVFTKDGVDDLVCHFSTQDVTWPIEGSDCGIIELTGNLLDGTPIQGTDTVCLPGESTCELGAPIPIP